MSREISPTALGKGLINGEIENKTKEEKEGQTLTEGEKQKL